MPDHTSNPFIEARNADLSPIPVRPGSKVPAVTWKQFQVEICSELQAVEWGNGGGYGIGLVTGEVSGRLMCIDIEAAFMDGHGMMELRRRLVGDLYDVLWSWISGYSESTPSGGLHILVRLEGDGACPRNEVFAADAAGKPLIETRGEGGYVLVAPTPGYVQGSGGFDEIAYCTMQEWLGVQAVLGSFDASQVPAPPSPTVATRSTVAFDDMLTGGSRWMDDAVAALGDIRVVLSANGWTPTGSVDRYGEHWTRPGKDPRHGSSGSISVNNRLYVHSSNAGMHVGNPTYDVLDVILFYELGRDASDVERVDWLKTQRPPAVRDAGATPTVSGAAALNLSPDFWAARPYLTHIHTAALSLRLSPDAVWAGVKCFYAACIPWNHRLPGDGTMDYISIVVGASGAGKSQAKHAAWRLLEDCHSIDGVYFPVPVGSGEGMTEIFVDRTDSERRYKARGAGFYADEGKFLLDIGGRSGSTTIQAIKQMWSGELTGSVAATAERHRWLDPRAVRATLLISTTPDIAAAFMRQDLTDEGLPQRVSWSWAHYPHPDEAPDWPGPLEVQIWDHNRTPERIYQIDLIAELADLIDERRLAAAKGQVDGLLEGHATYAILKSAAIHAHLDGRMIVEKADWDLASTEWEITRTVRQHLQRSQLAGLKDRNIALGHARADQKIAETDRYLEKAVLSLTRKLTNHKTALTLRQIKDHLRAYSKRHAIDYREVIALAIHRGLIQEAADGYLST